MSRYLSSLLVVLACLAAAGCTSVPGGTRAADAYSTRDRGEVNRRAAIRIQLATAYLQSGRYHVALEEIERALLVDSRSLDAHHVRALAAMQLGERAIAADSFRRVVTGRPDDGDALSNYGWFLCTGGEFDQGLGMLDRAAAVPMASAQPLANAGFCSMKKGDAGLAMNYFTRALGRDPGNVVASVGLARIHQERGEYSEARAAIERVNNGPSATAESLWLGVRIARRQGDVATGAMWTRELKRRYPGTPEARAAEAGEFND